jgi:hypothetical protein
MAKKEGSSGHTKKPNSNWANRGFEQTLWLAAGNRFLPAQGPPFNLRNNSDVTRGD